MQLKKLAENVRFSCLYGSLDKDITDVVYDSRKAKEGSIFVAIDGFRTDSHRFLAQVAAQGAAAVIVEKDWDMLSEEARKALTEQNVTVLKAENGRESLAALCAAWFGYPTREMKVVGITGTKGKTTSSHMLKLILEKAGYKVGLIGTNGIMIGQEAFPSHNTTPEPYELQKFARKMADEHCDYLVMEVSSSGLKHHRADWIQFDYGVFTNISPDHIGTLEHPDFEDYFNNKAKLFSRCRVGVFNRDDEHFPEMLAQSKCEVVTFGMKEKRDLPYPDFQGTLLESEKRGDVLGSRLKVEEKDASYELFVGMPGLFSCYNALSAITVARCIGVEPSCIQEALTQVEVEGRIEVLISNENNTVIMDYAHNGVSAAALFEMIRSFHPNRLIVVFGCEGDRAQIRRAELGEVVGKYADFCIMTAQNPGYEPLENIFRDIHVTLDPTGTPSADIPDRAEAIRYALRMAKKGDFIAVIGKGQEDTEFVNGTYYPFSDKKEILEGARELGWIK